MRVLRGRLPDREADRAVVSRMLDRAADGESSVRVWAPGRQLAFGRRDAREEGYEQARTISRAAGFLPVERSVGGRAVAYTETTLAFAHVFPIDDPREGLTDRYEHATDRLQRALWDVGVPAQRGEPDNSYCPGSHSLSYHGKLVGIAQRVRGDAALVSGVVLVDDHEEIARVLDPVYDVLGVPFDPDSVGSVDRAGGQADRTTVARAIESRLIGSENAELVQVDETDENGETSHDRET